MRKFYYQSIKERWRLDVGGLRVPSVELVRRSIQRVPAFIYCLKKRSKKKKPYDESLYT